MQLFTRRAQADAPAAGARRRRDGRGRGGVPRRWTGCRWRSSWRRRGCGRCRCATSRAGSTTGSRCCATRTASGPSGAGRCPARSRGATSCCSPTTSAGCGPCRASPAARRWTRPSTCSRRSDVPADVGARHDQPAGRPVAGQRGRASTTATVRYRLLDSIRAYAAERLRESGEARCCRGRARLVVRRTADWCDEHVRSERQPECLAIARAERANVDVALAWCAAHDPLLGVRIANGFGWTWVVLGDGTAGAARVRDALTAETPAPRTGDGTPARRVARGLGR